MINTGIILEILAFCSKGLANAGLKDLYEAWKKRVEVKLAGTTISKTIDSARLLEAYERDPNTWKQLLKVALDEVQVEKDTEIISGALQFLGLIRSAENNGTFQSFNNAGSGTQNNIGNKVVNNHTVYNQAPEYFDEIDESSGFRIRKTYRRNPDGACVIVAQQLA